ncbi:MAG: CRTAC1 family protein [Rhodothermales bacterium]
MLYRAVLGIVLLGTACSSDDSSGPAGVPDRSDAGRVVAPTFFTDVTEVAGLAAFRHSNGGFGEKWFPEIMGSGGAFVDYDGDGWLDILLVGGGSLPSRPVEDVPAVSLFRNVGYGTFRDVTRESGLSDVRAYGMGIAVADYDNDGDPDFLLTTLQENLLFRNDGGVFTEIGREAGIADVARWSTSAIFFDADRDGHLDIYVTNYVAWSADTDIECEHAGRRDFCNPRQYRGVADSFYRNDGRGKFVNAGESAGFHNGIELVGSRGLGVTELDFNNDGWPDVYVANDGGRNYLFRNDGEGAFTETATRSGVAFDQRGTPRAGMGVDVGVVDSTRELSIFVGNFSQETVSVWRHEQGGFFVDRAAVSGVGFPSRGTLTFGLVLFDIDLDTDLDLLLANGNVIEQIASMQAGVTFRERPQLFVNRGDGVFDEFETAHGPLSKRMLARGLAVGDVDRDGDLDMLVTENDGPAHLWRNDLDGGAFLRVRLQGTESNRDGVGARILAAIPGHTMERRVRAGFSYLSDSEKTATFGLGRHRDVSTLEVTWPSGRVERIERVASNQEVLLVEGSGDLVSKWSRSDPAQ